MTAYPFDFTGYDLQAANEAHFEKLPWWGVIPEDDGKDHGWWDHCQPTQQPTEQETEQAPANALFSWLFK